LDVTTIIAVYGAALSTILGAIELYRFRVEQQEKKPKVKVTLTTGLISQGNEVSPGETLKHPIHGFQGRVVVVPRNLLFFLG